MNRSEKLAILEQSNFFQAPPSEEFIKETDKFTEEMDQYALYGVAGEVIKRIEPHTEADQAALLISFLTAFGNIIGRTAYWVAESKKHHLNLFAVLVGQSSRGRKGSSWGHIERIFKEVEHFWVTKRIKSGLSSGEGLIYAVRDETEDDQGAEDKRLLVLEEEFSSVLRISERTGNTLTPQLRQAWDNGNIRTLTKNPLTATNAHISILAHITKPELLRYLSGTEINNGFANRFLWCFVDRSKELPEGGRFHEENIDDIVSVLKNCISFAETVGEIKRDNGASYIWNNGLYSQLTADVHGMTGAVTSRAEAQVMRLASLYALLDLSPVITKDHLLAGVAVWEYCFKSARYIFGTTLENPTANTILEHLKFHQEQAYQNGTDYQGMTRTEVSHLFNRNKSKKEVEIALTGLIQSAKVRIETSKGKGRPVQRIIPL